MASVQTCNMLLVLDMTLKSNIIYDIDQEPVSQRHCALLKLDFLSLAD